MQRVGNGWEPRRERGLKINRELQPEKPERLIKVSRNESVISTRVPQPLAVYGWYHGAELRPIDDGLY